METTIVREGGSAKIGEVGAYLRERRIDLGYELSDAVEHLNIRRTYLQAIEDGRWDALPGVIYTIGFLRSYANFLDLDGEDFIKRLREAGIYALPHEQIDRPAPVQDKRLPTGLILVVAAVICASAYAGWYFVSEEGDDVAGSVAFLPPEVAPQRMASETAEEETVTAEVSQDPGTELPGPETAANNPSDTSQVAAEDDSGEEPPQAMVALAPPDTGTSEVEVAEPVSEVDPEPNVTPEPGAEAEERVADNEPQVSPEAPAGDAGETPAVASSLPPVGSSSSAVAAPARPDGAMVPEGSASAGEPSGSEAAVEESRQASLSPEELARIRNLSIVLRATAPSWVLIRTPEDKVVYTRTMEPGDTYTLPKIRGMILWTGNAGGLVAIIGDERTSPLGPSGAVIRNISLDPEDLLSR